MRKIFNKEAVKRIFAKTDACENYRYKNRAFVLSSDIEADEVSYFDPSANGRKIALTVILLALAFFLQESVFTGLRFINVKAGLFLVVLSCIATCASFTFSLVTGVTSGLLLDIAFGRFLGFYAIIYMLFAVASNVLVPKSKKGKPFGFFWMAPFVFFVFGMAESILSRLLLMYNSKSSTFFENFGNHVMRRLVPGALFNGLLFILLIFPITFLWSKLGRKYISKMFK